MTIGASSRSYRFIVDMERNVLAKKMLYDRLANPDILTAKAEEQNNENTVFVGNIPFEATEPNVREFFSVCGTILSVHMPQGETIIILSYIYSNGLHLSEDVLNELSYGNEVSVKSIIESMIGDSSKK